MVPAQVDLTRCCSLGAVEWSVRCAANLPQCAKRDRLGWSFIPAVVCRFMS